MNSNLSKSYLLQKVAPVRIFEQAVEQIRELIISNAWPVGQKLPTEQELSKQLSVSRSSVREALRVLEAEGLIEVKRGSGAFVSEPRKAESEIARWLEQREETLEQVLQVRESIEGLTASLAASRISSTELEGIKAIYMQMKNILELESEETKTKELAVLDSAFHIAISAASGNDIADEIICHILPAFTEGNQAVLYLSQRAPRMVEEHRRIIEALEMHDSTEAETAMRDHIKRVGNEITGIKKAEEEI
jgi:GntR family transcriptional repressor for pyruvate dehydrogenase complex